MISRAIVFDVETPNSANDSISAIGLTVVENGVVGDTYYTLVDPEAAFDPLNIALTGIRPDMVVGKPNFAELWQKMNRFFDAGLLVAHNAPFDMGVLTKCLRRYGIAWKTQVDYLCTCRVARAVYPSMPDHRLNTMCDRFHIDLDHHNAASDSRAAATLFSIYEQRGLIVPQFIRTYDLIYGRTLQKKRKKEEQDLD